MSKRYIPNSNEVFQARLYHYSQNNPGGVFDDRFEHDVYIKAVSPEHADAIAMRMGLYFDGVAKGIDCPCCGNRWEHASDWDSEPA